MFKRILIPLDLTEKHQHVLDLAAELAEKGGAEVTLLHVIESIPGLSDEELKGFYSRLEQSAKKHLKNCGSTLSSRNINWESQVLIGPRIGEVTRYASENGTDLIVLTAPQVDPSNPGTSWASLSWKIGLLAPCPVLLVK